MILETVFTEGLAHLSYLIGDDAVGAAAVIDPRRDVDIYLQLARQNNVRITHILETHIHADFVSGSLELAARTGATIYAGAADNYGFAHHPLREGDTLELGSLPPGPPGPARIRSHFGAATPGPFRRSRPARRSS